MTEPQPRPDFERRHPRVSYEELRRQLIDADEDRYRLRSELASAVEGPGRRGSGWWGLRRRLVIGAGIVMVIGMAGGLVWQMCPSALRANDRSAVRVETLTVRPRILAREMSEAKAGPLKAAARSNLKPRLRSVRTTPDRNVAQPPRRRTVPRPLSPGEFGRPRIAVDDVQP